MCCKTYGVARYLVRLASENVRRIRFSQFSKTLDDFAEAIDVINFVHAINDLSNKVAYL